MAGAQLGVPGSLSPVDAANGYASEFQYILGQGANILAGNLITVPKEYVIDQGGHHAARDVYFLLPGLPKSPPVYPPFELTLDVGGDAYVGPSEVSSMTGMTATVTSSAIRALVVSGLSNGQQLQETAVWNPSTQTYEFNAAQFDDGTLTVLATDVYGQTESFTLIKDSVAPTILDFSVAGPISLSVTSSEPGLASLCANSAHIAGSDGLISAANTPTTMNVLPQSSVITATLVVEDNVGLQTTGSTSVVLGTNGADTSMTGTSGPDFMFGFAGNDSITGGAAADVIYGGADNDTITGGAGNDSLNGEAGNDQFVYDAGASSYVQGILPRYDTVNGGDGTDTIYAWAGGGAPTGADLTDADFANVSNMEAITLAAGSYSASVVLGANANTAFANGVTVTIDSSTTVAATVNGSAYTHAMTVTGGAQNDSITGGSANDSLTGGAGNDTMTGGTGVDQIDISAGGADRITLGNSANGIDVITGFGNDDAFQFAALANGYLNDSARTYGQATLTDAASAAALNAGAYRAIGFIYQSNQYILINVDTTAYVASTDALVQVIGTDLATLSGANFGV